MTFASLCGFWILTSAFSQYLPLKALSDRERLNDELGTEQRLRKRAVDELEKKLLGRKQSLICMQLAICLEFLDYEQISPCNPN